MGNSTKSVQSIIDFANTIGDLTPVLTGTGGFSREPALTIANDVMTELIAERFNWKWNQKQFPAFVTNSWQQDYPQINTTDVGWLEKAFRTDINNTSMPKPTFPIETVRDLDPTSQQFGWPGQICWLYNRQLEHAKWPGADKTYTDPLGATTTPANPYTNILDANGNILIVTTYGITGTVAPAAPKGAAAGVTVEDGTVVWTVCNPDGMGIRIFPKPPQAGNVWLVRTLYQMKPPSIPPAGTPTTKAFLASLIDPIPDEYAKYYRDGFIAFCHKHSPDPKVKARFPQMYTLWEQQVFAAAKAGDKEQENRGFFPDRGIMSGGDGVLPIGPAWPFSPVGIG
jgi:hypothetical protein